VSCEHTARPHARTHADVMCAAGVQLCYSVRWNAVVTEIKCEFDKEYIDWYMRMFATGK
jgi:hypothetical protein